MRYMVGIGFENQAFTWHLRTPTSENSQDSHSSENQKNLNITKIQTISKTPKFTNGKITDQQFQNSTNHCPGLFNYQFQQTRKIQKTIPEIPRIPHILKFEWTTSFGIWNSKTVQDDGCFSYMYSRIAQRKGEAQDVRIPP